MQITRGEQQHVFEIHGAKFFYRLCTDPEFEDIVRSNIKDERTGEIDHAVLRKAVLARCVVGWDGVRDGDTGESLDFEPGLIGFLPTDVCMLVTAEAIRHITDRRKNTKQPQADEKKPTDEEVVAQNAAPLPESESPVMPS